MEPPAPPGNRARRTRCAVIVAAMLAATLWPLWWWCTDRTIKYEPADPVWVWTPSKADATGDRPRVRRLPDGKDVEFVSWEFNGDDELTLYYGWRQPAGWLLGRPAKVVYEHPKMYAKTAASDPRDGGVWVLFRGKQ